MRVIGWTGVPENEAVYSKPTAHDIPSTKSLVEAPLRLALPYPDNHHPPHTKPEYLGIQMEHNLNFIR